MAEIKKLLDGLKKMKKVVLVHQLVKILRFIYSPLLCFNDLLCVIFVIYILMMFIVWLGSN